MIANRLFIILISCKSRKKHWQQSKFINKRNPTKWITSSKNFYYLLMQTLLRKSWHKSWKFFHSIPCLFMKIKSCAYKFLIEDIDEPNSTQNTKRIFMKSSFCISNRTQHSLTQVLYPSKRIYQKTHIRPNRNGIFFCPRKKYFFLKFAFGEKFLNQCMILHDNKFRLWYPIPPSFC